MLVCGQRNGWKWISTHLTSNGCNRFSVVNAWAERILNETINTMDEKTLNAVKMILAKYAAELAVLAQTSSEKELEMAYARFMYYSISDYLK